MSWRVCVTRICIPCMSSQSTARRAWTCGDAQPKRTYWLFSADTNKSASALRSSSVRSRCRISGSSCSMGTSSAPTGVFRSVIGDGVSDVRQLVERRTSALLHEGRDLSHQDEAHMMSQLRGQGLTLDSVVALGKVVELLDVSNLSAGGTGADHTSRAHPRWTNLACHITDRMGLRFCGVDIACPDSHRARALIPFSKSTPRRASITTQPWGPVSPRLS